MGGGSLGDFTSYSAGQTLLVLNVETIKGLVLSGSKQQASYRGVDCGQPAAPLLLPMRAGSPCSGDHTCLPQYTAGPTSLRGSGEGRAGWGNTSSPHTSIKRPQETCGRDLAWPESYHWQLCDVCNIAHCLLLYLNVLMVNNSLRMNLLEGS